MGVMPDISKAELRRRIDDGLAAFLETIDSLTEDEAKNPVDDRGWNVCDHLTHLAVWAEGIAALTRHQARWQTMGLSIAEPEAEPDYDLLNAEIVEQHRHLTFAQAREWVAAAHRKVAEAVDALSEEDLGLPYQRFVAPFTGDWGEPIAEYILGNTEDHYEEHTPWVLAIAKRAAR